MVGYRYRIVVSLGGVAQSFDSPYFRVFGLAPFFAHLADSSYFEGEGVVERIPVVGDRVDLATFIGFWTLLFGALYFRFIFRGRRTI